MMLRPMKNSLEMHGWLIHMYPQINAYLHTMAFLHTAHLWRSFTAVIRRNTDPQRSVDAHAAHRDAQTWKVGGGRGDPCHCKT